MKFYLFFTVIVGYFLFSNSNPPLQKNRLDYLKNGYYLSVYKADSLFLDQNYSAAYHILDSLFNIYKPSEIPPYYEYQTYLKAAYLSNMMVNDNGLKILIREYGVSWEILVNDKHFKRITNEYNFTKEEYDEERKLYNSVLNKKLASEILSRYELDQKFRRNKKIFWENKDIQDSIDVSNSNFAINFLDSYGYPLPYIIGYPPESGVKNSDFLTLLLHSKSDLREKEILPRILKLVKNGKCNPMIYAQLYDQMQLHKSLPQKYGSIKSKKINLISKDSLNHFRKSIGLPVYGYEKWRLEKILDY